MMSKRLCWNPGPASTQKNQEVYSILSSTSSRVFPVFLPSHLASNSVSQGQISARLLYHPVASNHLSCDSVFSALSQSRNFR